MNVPYEGEFLVSTTTPSADAITVPFLSADCKSMPECILPLRIPYLDVTVNLPAIGIPKLTPPPASILPSGVVGAPVVAGAFVDVL